MYLLAPPTAPTFCIPLPCRNNSVSKFVSCCHSYLSSWLADFSALHITEGIIASCFLFNFRSSLTGLWIFEFSFPEVHYFNFVALFHFYTKDHTSLIPNTRYIHVLSKVLPLPQNQIWKKLPPGCWAISVSDTFENLLVSQWTAIPFSKDTGIVKLSHPQQFLRFDWFC